MNDSIDGRRSRRYICHGPIKFRIHNGHATGKIINLCLEGCFIQPNQEICFFVGDTFDLRFEVNHLVFLAQCVVRRVAKDRKIGVEIVMMSRRGHQQLIELLRELAMTTENGA